MAQTPSSFSVPQVTRGTLISELNIVVPRAYNGFINKWGWVPYIMMSELAGNEMPTDNKLFYWYEQAGRPMGFVLANATVAGTAGSAVTVTVAAGGYSVAGTRSLPEIGKIFYNARSGVEARITAVNKTTPNAHTFTFVPVRAADNAGVTIGDVLQDRGYKYVGEASGYTGTDVRNIDKFTNYCTQLRIDAKFTDLSLAERIDFEFEGNHFYKYKQLADKNQEFMWQKELMLMDSNLTDNLGYTETGSAGVIQQVQANGATINYSTFGAQTTFAQVERYLDSQGAPAEYDWLSDTNQNLDIQIALGNEFNNGAIVYAQTGDMAKLDLKRGFKTFTPFQRTYNFTRYGLFSDAVAYGSSPTGSKRDNFGLLIPKSNVTDAKSRNVIPQFCVRYQNINGFGKVVISESGALSQNGKTPVMDLTVSQEAHMGVQVMGANQYVIVSK